MSPTKLPLQYSISIEFSKFLRGSGTITKLKLCEVCSQGEVLLVGIISTSYTNRLTNPSEGISVS